MLSSRNFAAAESEDRLSRHTLFGDSIRRLGSTRWLPFAILVASILVTLTFWTVLPNSYRLNEQSDYFASYEPTARNLLAGRGLVHGTENPATEYPPGYPLILAGVFGVSQLLNIPAEVSISVFEIVGMAVSSVLVFFLTRLIFGVGAALVSSSLWMTYPFVLWLTKQPNSEIPFIVVLYASLLLFWYALIHRPRARAIYFVCGLLCGFAMLIRPAALGISITLSVITWFVRREAAAARLLPIGLLLLGSLAAIFPWEAYVYSKTGSVIPLSTNGVKGMRDGLTFAVTTKGYREEGGVSPEVAEVMRDVLAQADQITTFRQVGTVMAREFQSHPVAVAKLFLLKVARSWYGTDSGRKEWPILLVQLTYLALISWSIRWAWLKGGIYRSFAMGALLITVYFWAMTVMALSILRYMVPTTGLLFVLVGGACANRWRSNRESLPRAIR